MISITKQILDCFSQGNSLWIVGNGGSSAEASHLSEELITLGYPAIALNDPQVITALSNDYSYEKVFSLYVFAVGKVNDILLVLSTSGKSKNCLRAIKIAKEKGMYVIDFPRPGKSTEDIQNKQLQLIHRIYKELK